MAVEFDGTNGYLDFGAIVNNQTVKSVTAWIYLDTVVPVQGIVAKSGAGWVLAANTNDLYYEQACGTSAVFGEVANVLSVSTNYHVAVTHDVSSGTILPVLYLNGVLQVLTSSGTASGTMGDDSDGTVVIGAAMGASHYHLDGKIQDVRIYNRILSANEILALYNSRCLRNVMNGLVFWAPMWGANADTFEGNTLSASETVVDWIGGAVGVPTGSPIGIGNTFQGN